MLGFALVVFILFLDSCINETNFENRTDFAVNFPVIINIAKFNNKDCFKSSKDHPDNFKIVLGLKILIIS